MSTSTPPRQPNRLIHETSPYLLQHAYNPVAWYPWGPEALETAKKRNMPILLSIGYAACLREPRIFDLWLTKVSRCPRVPNFRAWRCNSYSA